MQHEDERHNEGLFCVPKELDTEFACGCGFLLLLLVGLIALMFMGQPLTQRALDSLDLLYVPFFESVISNIHVLIFMVWFTLIPLYFVYIQLRAFFKVRETGTEAETRALRRAAKFAGITIVCISAIVFFYPNGFISDFRLAQSGQHSVVHADLREVRTYTYIRHHQATTRRSEGFEHFRYIRMSPNCPWRYITPPTPTGGLARNIYNAVNYAQSQMPAGNEPVPVRFYYLPNTGIIFHFDTFPL
ncbi:MAG: hypothetical protein FWC89_02650 [Defluviitaleaceae bacterium]|nr:hypothetical protein [Defluviitaleaceae bacterium]